MPAKKKSSTKGKRGGGEYDPPRRKVQTVNRYNMAPLGRPPEDPKARSVYDGLKRRATANAKRRDRR